MNVRIPAVLLICLMKHGRAHKHNWQTFHDGRMHARDNVPAQGFVY